MISLPNVSRVLTPDSKGFSSVVALNDKDLTDADLNLIQSVQDFKRRALTKDTVCSGCLTYQPFKFNPYIENTFNIPAFDVLMNGDVVRVAGNNTADLTTNRVTLPAPVYWTSGQSGDPARVWVVFLEFWYAYLNPTTGSVTGYYANPSTGKLYYYPYGCINADVSNMIPIDTIDPFMGVETTRRIQLQWAIRVKNVALSYDFSTYQFGLDPGQNSSETVYPMGTQSSDVTSFMFANMAAVNGDAGLWRAGDGTLNNLVTVDGYSYALPLAVVFQLNTGVFSVSDNPFGCADPSLASTSGLLRYDVSGRYDKQLADSIIQDNVVDTRSTVSLSGWGNESLMAKGFGDLITNKTTSAIGRGISPGNPSTALGSRLSYYVSMAPTPVPGTDTVGVFDGFANGFSSDQRVFKTTSRVSINQKAIGVVGGRWTLNDAFVVALPDNSPAVISSIDVQGLYTNLDGSKSPILLMQGQLDITGLGTTAVTTTFLSDLAHTSFDPSVNDLYVTIGVQYPAGSLTDLRVVPSGYVGGVLKDASNGTTFPVYGVSEYVIQAPQKALTALALNSVNPEYSNTVFGTRAWIRVAGSTGMQQTTSTGGVLTTFTVNRLAPNIEGNLSALYPTRCWDYATGVYYVIQSRTITSSQMVVTVQGSVDINSTVVMSVLCDATAQAAFNAPVKGLVSVEETILFGTANTLGNMDNRVQVVSSKFVNGGVDPGQNTIVLAVTDGMLKGVSGDDVSQFVWVQGNSGSYSAVPISTVTISDGLVTLVVPASVNLIQQAWFCVGSLLPAFSPQSTLTVQANFTPYQGEGVLNRDYEVVHADAMAMVTTNGTGAAPVPGLQDVFPYNRNFPISVALPTQAGWNDATLENAPVASYFDNNYDAKQGSNIETIFEVPCHTNDFVPTITSDKRTAIRLVTQGSNRGFSQALPHTGFAIRPLQGKTILGAALQATTGPIQLYVNNVSGDDTLDGLTPKTAKLSIQSAVQALPSVITYPCVIELIPTGHSYQLSNMANSLTTVALGDGEIVSSEYFALANISFTVQGSGRLVVSTQAGSGSTVVIDGAGATNGSGPVSAFFVDQSRVIFNNIQFQNFVSPAVKGIKSDIEFVACKFIDNLTSGSFENCDVTLSGGAITSGTAGVGMVLSSSRLTSSNTSLVADQNSTPGAFFVANYNSSVTLENHTTDSETNISNTTVVAQATFNSSVVCSPGFVSGGQAVLRMNSVLSRTVALAPFEGGIAADSTSTEMVALS